MTKRKNIFLEWDEDEAFPYDIYGICCHYPNYRVAFELNGLFGLHFQQCEWNFHSEQKKLKGCSFPMYEQRYESASMFMIQNKHLGKTLVGEKPTVDFWLFVHELFDWPIAETMNKLQKVPIFLASFHFTTEEIPSTQFIHLE